MPAGLRCGCVLAARCRGPVRRDVGPPAGCPGGSWHSRCAAASARCGLRAHRPRARVGRLAGPGWLQAPESGRAGELWRPGHLARPEAGRVQPVRPGWGGPLSAAGRGSPARPRAPAVDPGRTRSRGSPVTGECGPPGAPVAAPPDRRRSDAPRSPDRTERRPIRRPARGATRRRAFQTDAHSR